MTAAPSILEEATLTITQEIRVHAPLQTTYAALLEQLGQGNEHPDGTPMPMKLEAWPGGRWWRDLGDGDGHFWAHVQAIKKGTLLELCGPLFMSEAVMSNVQYRLSEEGGETLMRFRHKVFGAVPEELVPRMNEGWSFIHAQAKKHAEADSRQ